VDPAAYFDAHGESQCLVSNETDSFHCMNFEQDLLPTPMKVNRAIEIILMMNDVRPAGTSEMTFYYSATLTFCDELLYPARYIKGFASRHIQSDPSGVRPSPDIFVPSGALLRVDTTSDSVSIYRFSFPFAGTLLTNITWIHGHWSSMKFAFLIDELSCGGNLTSILRDSSGPMLTSTFGFPSNLVLQSHILQACPNGIVCQALGNRISLLGNEFDRFPNVSCATWGLGTKREFVSVAFHGHVQGNNIKNVEFAHVNWNVLYISVDNRSHFTSNFANEPRSEVVHLSATLREILLFAFWTQAMIMEAPTSTANFVLVVAALGVCLLSLNVRAPILTCIATTMAGGLVAFHLQVPAEVYFMRDEEAAALLLQRFEKANSSSEVHALLIILVLSLLVFPYVICEGKGQPTVL